MMGVPLLPSPLGRPRNLTAWQSSFIRRRPTGLPGPPEERFDKRQGSEQTWHPGRGCPELGIVRIQSRPTADAQDRLRRLFSLLVRYTTQEGQAEKQDGNCAPDEQGPDDPTNGEA